ncbi:MAG: hypothetical protein R6V34_06450 [Bacteroidales bacterium]
MLTPSLVNDSPGLINDPHNVAYNEDVVKQHDTGIVDFFWGEQMWWDTRSLK